MNALKTALRWLGAWLSLAADGFASMVDATRARRAFRLVEEDGGDFTLWHKVGRAEWTSFAVGLQVEDGAIVSALPARTRASMRAANVEVVLRQRHFVVSPLELPSGAAGFLDGVVRTQIDRLTPWRANEAAFGYTSPQTFGKDRIAVQVVATARGRLTPFVRGFSAYEIDSLRVLTDIGDDQAKSEVCVFAQTLGAVSRVQHLRAWLGAGLAAAALAAVAALVAWWVVGTGLDSQRDDLQAAIDQRRAALLAKRGGSSEVIAALDEKKRASLPAVLTLEKLSETLPDGAYLTDLHIEGDKLQLAGLTDDAPGLIRLIEQSQQFSHATFFEPTTRSQNEAGARFHIEARIEPKWARTP